MSNPALADFQQLIMVKNALSAIGLRGEDPWKCVHALIAVLLEHERDIVDLQRRLHNEIKKVG